jgi:hypothetical protein
MSTGFHLLAGKDTTERGLNPKHRKKVTRYMDGGETLGSPARRAEV